jgi:hypothetical protein
MENSPNHENYINSSKKKKKNNFFVVDVIKPNFHGVEK